METLIRWFKDRDKNIVFMDCQIHFLNIYLRRKGILLIFFRHFVEPPAKINRYWTIFETLAEIERDYKERQLCMGDYEEQRSVSVSCPSKTACGYLIHTGPCSA